MSPFRCLFLALIASCVCSQSLFAQDPLFEETFDGKLSEKWQLVGLKPEDYRLKDGGIELRIQPGELTANTPRLLVELPFSTQDTVVASLEVTLLQPLGKAGEFAGLFLTQGEDLLFSVKKTNINGYQVFSPGEPEFIGQPGEEGDPMNYTVKFWPAKDSAGPLRLLVRGDYAYFQVGPSTEGMYATYFHSAITEHRSGLGFAIIAAGAPEEGEHWVRFDHFRVDKN